MGGLAEDAFDLVDELMRHLVLEHVDDHRPWIQENARRADGDRSRGAVPVAKPRELARQGKDRALKLSTKEEKVEPRPLGHKSPKALLLKLRRELLEHVMRSVHATRLGVRVFMRF